MSWNIDICHKKQDEYVTVVLKESHQIKGGTYAIGGHNESSLNITYNYGRYFSELWEGALWFLQNKTTKDMIPELEKAVHSLGTKQDNDYWESTSGNAGRALEHLLHLCRVSEYENPDELLYIQVS